MGSVPSSEMAVRMHSGMHSGTDPIVQVPLYGIVIVARLKRVQHSVFLVLLVVRENREGFLFLEISL